MPSFSFPLYIIERNNLKQRKDSLCRENQDNTTIWIFAWIFHFHVQRILDRLSYVHDKEMFKHASASPSLQHRYAIDWNNVTDIHNRIGKVYFKLELRSERGKRDGSTVRIPGECPWRESSRSGIYSLHRQFSHWTSETSHCHFGSRVLPPLIEQRRIDSSSCPMSFELCIVKHKRCWERM